MTDQASIQRGLDKFVPVSRPVSRNPERASIPANRDPGAFIGSDLVFTFNLGKAYLWRDRFCISFVRIVAIHYCAPQEFQRPHPR
jgi:hypothetical protein